MLHLINPCAKRKVLSLTKPKGKIYKTKSLHNYITVIAGRLILVGPCVVVHRETFAFFIVVHRDFFLVVEKHCFTCSAQNVLLILIEWFIRWEVSGRTAVDFYSTAFRISSKYFNSNLAFSAGVSLITKCCNHTVVLTQLQLGKIPVLQNAIWSISYK